MCLRVMLVDLPPLTSLGIQIALSALPGDVEVKEVDQRDRAITITRDGDVDIAIFDAYRPSLDDGLRFCRQVKEAQSPPYLLALSQLRHQRDLMYCFLAGVDSFISADEDPRRLVSAVESTLRGRREWVLGTTADSTDNLDSSAALTARELEVMWMVRERYSNRQIATSLVISPNTVKNHVAAILRKLDVRQRSQLYSGPLPRT